jgi:serine/threonine-protein kinase
MGIVYKSRDIRLGRVVALKLLSSEPAAAGDRRIRFLSEAQAASALNHPNEDNELLLPLNESTSSVWMRKISGSLE